MLGSIAYSYGSSRVAILAEDTMAKSLRTLVRTQVRGQSSLRLPSFSTTYTSSVQCTCHIS